MFCVDVVALGTPTFRFADWAVSVVFCVVLACTVKEESWH
jgi:hypothetical protein